MYCVVLFTILTTGNLLTPCSGQNALENLINGSFTFVAASSLTTNVAYGEPCFRNSQCINNLYCIDNKCSCSRFQHYTPGTESCAKCSINCNCTSSEQCHANLVCERGQCGCYSSQYLNHTTEECEGSAYTSMKNDDDDDDDREIGMVIGIAVAVAVVIVIIVIVIACVVITKIKKRVERKGTPSNGGDEDVNERNDNTHASDAETGIYTSVTEEETGTIKSVPTEGPNNQDSMRGESSSGDNFSYNMYLSTEADSDYGSGNVAATVPSNIKTSTRDKAIGYINAPNNGEGE